MNSKAQSFEEFFQYLHAPEKKEKLTNDQVEKFISDWVDCIIKGSEFDPSIFYGLIPRHIIELLSIFKIVTDSIHLDVNFSTMPIWQHALGSLERDSMRLVCGEVCAKGLQPRRTNYDVMYALNGDRQKFSLIILFDDQKTFRPQVEIASRIATLVRDSSLSTHKALLLIFVKEFTPTFYRFSLNDDEVKLDGFHELTKHLGTSLMDFD